MKIGFVTIWAHRGQAYVTKAIKEALDKEHETFVFARKGFVYKNNKELYPIQETTGEWKAKNIYLYPEYKINPVHLADWVIDNKIDCVVFNEEYQWELVSMVNSLGVKTVTYVDWFCKETMKNHIMYDLNIICAKHTAEAFREHNLPYEYIDWGVDTKRFKPQENKDKCTFFHSSGWGGVNLRKCTDIIFRCFADLSKKYKDISLFWHSQSDLSRYPDSLLEIIKKYNVKTFFGDVDHPCLYHKGKIHLAVSKLEGLGLYIPEGLACGLPTITTNEPPMNQFVDNNNGFPVRSISKHKRADNYYFNEYEIDEKMLYDRMEQAINLGDKEYKEKSKNAIETIKDNYGLEKFNKNIIKLFGRL